MAALSKKKKNKADIDNNEDLADFNTENDFAVSPKSRKEKDKGEGGGKAGVIALVVGLVLIVTFLVGVVVFNLFGLRDNQLRGVLEKIPIVNNVLPAAESADPVLSMSNEELLAEIERLTREKDTLSAEVDRLGDLNDTYLGEISTLREYEENQLQYKADKEEFDRIIGMGDTVGFEKFYEQISPENAENIYREVVGINNTDKEFKSFVSTFEKMDESSAAQIFDQLVRTDVDLAVRILQNISSEQRAGILAAMTITSAELVTRRMAPGNIIP